MPERRCEWCDRPLVPDRDPYGPECLDCWVGYRLPTSELVKGE